MKFFGQLLYYSEKLLKKSQYAEYEDGKNYEGVLKLLTDWISKSSFTKVLS